MKMAGSVNCPIGMGIETVEECEDALLWALDLGINMYSSRSSSVVQARRSYDPYQCHYQSGGDLAFHFNTYDSGSDSSGFINGDDKLICRKGIKYQHQCFDVHIHILIYDILYGMIK